jgi:diguanylate cyclase
MPVDEMRAARLVAERQRGAVARSPCPFAGGTIPLTVSIGGALFADDEALDGAIARADAALYRAKREGRDQVQMELRAA